MRAMPRLRCGILGNTTCGVHDRAKHLAGLFELNFEMVQRVGISQVYGAPTALQFKADISGT